MKSILYYVYLNIIRIVHLIISIIFYPIAFLFRHKSNAYVKVHGNMGWHPLQWTNWFFTREGDIGDFYTGPIWYMREWKEKYFTKFIDEEMSDPIPQNLKEKFIYFLISYRWSGIRNFMWNLHRIINQEGGIWNGVPKDSIRVIKSTILIKDEDILKGAALKYIDKDGNYRDNKGTHICYPNNQFNIPVRNCYLEGVHYGKFKTMKMIENDGVERFNYSYAKVYPLPLINRLFCLEIKLGWAYYMGWQEFHMKFNFKKYDDFARKNHEEYLKNKN